MAVTPYGQGHGTALIDCERSSPSHVIKSACPYPDGSRSAQEWVRGYHDGVDDWEAWNDGVGGSLD